MAHTNVTSTACTSVSDDELKRVYELDLSSKMITALQSNDFSGLLRLNNINLSGNQLKSLPDGIFSNTSLSQITLSRNQLTSLPDGIFSGLSTLHSLFLSRNQLASLPDGIFSDTILRDITLAENQLASLPDDIFSDLPTLRRLLLDKNQLATLPDDIFSGLSNLQTLNLSENQLATLPEQVFSGLSSLETLYLGGNQFVNFPGEMFSDLSDLTFFSFNDNSQLTSVSPKAFSGLSSIIEIRLQQNILLTRLPAAIFSELSPPVTIKLEGTPISPKVIILPGFKARTSEANEDEGNSVTIQVRLATPPTAEATVTPSSSDPGEGAVSGPVTFSVANWYIAQNVTVTGVNDDDVDGDQPYQITFSSASADQSYNINGDNLLYFINDDDDTEGPEVRVTDAENLETSEDGTTATFQMRLATRPTAAVTVTPSSGATDEGVVSPASLTFTASNWATAQSVTVTGQDDAVVDGDQSYRITFSVSSSDTDYNRIAVTALSVINRDDEEESPGGDPEVRVTGAENLETSEDGSRVATFQVRLATRPTAAVTVTPSSGATDEGVVSPISLTFTASNWATAQSVTVTGQDDAEDDGDQDYQITFSVSSSDTDYNRIAVPPLSVVNKDNDGASVRVTGAENLETSEDGSRVATFQMRLATRPTAAVTVTPSSGATDEGVVSPASLTFTASNWATAQSVTVTGQDDAEDDGDQDYQITFSVSSSDTDYNRIAVTPLSVINRDDEEESPGGDPEVRVTDAENLETSEDGTTATFQMRLATRPTAAVTVTPSSSATDEGVVSPVSLTFTASNWATAQSVTVTGQDDAVVDGDQSYRITFSVSSSDTDYNRIAVTALSVINRDDEEESPGGDPEVRVTGAENLETSEDGSRVATFQVRLATRPTAAVTVTPSSSATDEGVVSPASLTFTASNWATAQSVTVTGQDDAEDDGDQDYQITFSVSSSDTDYNRIAVTALSVINRDDEEESPGGDPEVRVTGAENLETSEDGSRVATFQVRLATRPTAAVTVTPSSGATDEGVVSPVSLTFTASNWATAQSVTVIGQDDAVVDGDQSYRITFSVSSSDTDYNNIAVTPLSVVNKDNDGASVRVTGAENLETSEDGSRVATFQVRLATRPTAAVTVTPSSGATDEGVVSPASLTFTASNWATAQSVTVTGQDDAVVDGDQSYRITFSVSSSDADYNRIAVTALSVINRDDDVPPPSEMEMEAAQQAVDTSLPGLGNTVAGQVLDAVQGRFQGGFLSSPQFNLAGQSMVGTPLEQHLLAWAAGRGVVTGQQLVEGTSFDLTLVPENGAAPRLSVWAMGDLARFDRADDDDLSLDGNVTTALVGGDWGREQWSAGAALARSWSSSSYSSGEEKGESDVNLTTLLPYGHYDLNPQLSLWGMVGYGWGDLSLTPEGREAMETDVNLSLAAVGLEGLVLDGGRDGLTIRSMADALLVNVSSEESDDLAETKSAVSRLRLGLQAVRSFPLENDASLAPMVEVALRRDDGDAETGFGLDLGAGLDWSSPRQGIRADLEGRVLLYHAAEGFHTSGISASLEWDSAPSTEHGASLSLKHGVGAATGGGRDALLSPASLPELASAASSREQQFQALLGYGFAPWGEEGLSIRPEIGLGLSPGRREYSLSWNTSPYIQPGEESAWEVSTTAKRQEDNDSHPAATHSLALRFSLIL